MRALWGRHVKRGKRGGGEDEDDRQQRGREHLQLGACTRAYHRSDEPQLAMRGGNVVRAMWDGKEREGGGGGGGGGNDGRQQRGSEHLQLAACTHACHRGIEPQLAMCGGNVVRVRCGMCR